MIQQNSYKQEILIMDNLFELSLDDLYDGKSTLHHDEPSLNGHCIKRRALDLILPSPVKHQNVSQLELTLI